MIRIPVVLVVWFVSALAGVHGYECGTQKYALVATLAAAQLNQGNFTVFILEIRQTQGFSRRSPKEKTFKVQQKT